MRSEVFTCLSTSPPGTEHTKEPTRNRVKIILFVIGQ